MAKMVIFGDVEGDGSYTVKEGSDGSFSALRVDHGTYAIDFVPDFAEPPVVMVTVRSMGITEQKEDVALVRPAPGQCLVFMRNAASAERQDADFSFVAMGLANGKEPGAKKVAPPEPEVVPESDIDHNTVPEIPQIE